MRRLLASPSAATAVPRDDDPSAPGSFALAFAPPTRMSEKPLAAARGDRLDPYVDPEMRRVLSALAVRDGGLPDYSTLPPAEARALFRRVHQHWNATRPPMRRVTDLVVPGAASLLRARLYDPGEESSGLVVYLHGGGWVLGDLDTHERAGRMLARASNALVLALDYRRPPENPFPAPLDDVVSVLEWLRLGPELPMARCRLAVAGDSAGANLALAAMLEMRARGLDLPSGAALFYGAYDQARESGSQRAFGDGRFGLTTARMRWYAELYVGGRTELLADPRVSPLRADLRGLPPLFLNSASLDPLLDDTTDLCERLDRVGVEHECVVYDGVVHGFMQMSAELSLARRAFDDAGAALGRMLAA